MDRTEAAIRKLLAALPAPATTSASSATPACTVSNLYQPPDPADASVPQTPERSRRTHLRQAHRESPYTLLDDLTTASLLRLVAEGYRPAAVVETSPGSFQAWLRHTQPLSKELGTLAAQTLAEQFGADRGAADWHRFGRAPGFTNRKPQHRNPQGLYPFARLTSHDGQPFAFAETFRLRLVALQQAAEQERAAARLRFTSRPTHYAALLTLSRFRTSPRYDGRPAAADMAFCIAACAQGWSESDIAAELSRVYLSRDTSRTRQLHTFAAHSAKPCAGLLRVPFFPTLLPYPLASRRRAARDVPSLEFLPF